MSLVQTCDVDENEKSYFLTSIDGQTITKSLYNANGKCGDVGVSSTKDLVTKCTFSTTGKPVPVNFHAGLSRKAVVVDIDVICFKNNRYGIVVATNEPSTEDNERAEDDDGFITKKAKAEREKTRHYNPVALYMENYLNEFKHLRTIKVYGEITCMRVLVSPVEMASQAPFLSAKLASWQNIVAIGCSKSSCFLGQFSEFDPEKGEHWNEDRIVEVPATTDALKSLCSSNGQFNYLASYFMRDEEQVTAVSYIPCYAVVVVGISNGAIVMVPLDGKSCISCLTVPYSTPISFLVVLEPEFDPAGGFYVFSARERPAKSIKNSALAVFSHKISRTPAGDGGYEYQDMNSVMIPMRDGAYWINVHGVVKKRKRREADASNDTAGDNSQLPEGLNTTQHMYGDGMERTLLFYSYITLTGEMKGGLFDLNAFYSRRCTTQQVRLDEYGQDPICSQFTLTVPLRNTGVPLFRAKDISWVHCQNISRYSSPLFDREPLFQPGAAALSLTIHTFGQHAYAATVQSLQYTVLDRIAGSISASLAQPDLAISLLERAGLVLAPTTKKERMRMEERPAADRVPSELDKIMRALVSDEYARTQVIWFINDSFDRKQQLHVGRWMFNELRDIVVRMDESIAPLFDGVAPDLLSKDAQEMMAYCPAFFEFAELVFWKLRGRGQELANDTTRLRYVRKVHAQTAFDLRLFLAAIKWFIRKLPMCEVWTADLLEEVAEISDERRQRAGRNRHPLFLDALLSRLHEKTMEDPLWRGEADPVDWYPPGRFHLLSLLRQNEPALADRTALVLYWLMDVDEAVRRDGVRPRDQKRGYPVKDSLVRSFLIWEAGKLMDGQGCDGVRERWDSDWKGGQKESQAAGGVQPMAAKTSRLTDAEKEELSNLLKSTVVFRKLQRVDEDRMKVLLNKQDFGIYRWNVFLIKKGRYPEVEDLPIPRPNEAFPHIVVKEYAKYKELALAQKAQLPPPTYSNAFACPYVITKAVPKPADDSPDPNASRIVKTGHITIRGKTPKKLNIFKRLTTGATAAGAAGAAGPSRDIMSTPPSQTGAASTETARINALLKTPSMRFRNQQDALEEEEEAGEGRENDSNVAPDEMARVREALRTPRSRAATSAAEGTPEDATRSAMTAPQSILKSGRKESRLPQSVTKSRLRFAKVFEEKSISPRERDNSTSTLGSMSQPNFDDSFDDEQVLSKSPTGAGSSELNSTRLEREIEEEEAKRKRREDVSEASMEPSYQYPPSPGAQEEEEDETEGGEEEEEGLTDGWEESLSEKTMELEGYSYSDPGSTRIYNSASFISMDDAPSRPRVAAAADEEEEEEERDTDSAPSTDNNAADAAFIEYGSTSSASAASAAATTPDEEKEEEREDDHSQEVAAAAASAAPAAAVNETFTIANATFTVDLRGARGREGEEEEAAAAAAVAVAAAGDDDAATDATLTPDEEQMEQAEGETVEPRVSRVATPVNDEQREDEEKFAAAAAAGDAVDGDENQEEEEKEEAADVSRAETPVEEDEKVEIAEPVEEAQLEVAVEQQEEEAAASAADAAALAPLPPRPKPRTVFANRAEPMALGLRSYIYMDGNVEKSFEEQQDTTDDDEHADKDILARLPATRRSSSRLQQHRGEEAAAAAPAAASAPRKRGASRGRKDSEKDVAGPSSPRGKKERRDGEDEEEDGHLYTTTRTRVVEERYMERDDGVLQHTIKQSTKVIETTDGVVVKDEREDRETIEEEGDREEMDEADRVTPPMIEAAAEPTTGRSSSRAAAAASRSRTVSTASKSPSRGKKEEDEKKREERATTPLCTPVKPVRRRNLMVEERKEQEEDKKQEEPVTPRRSSRARKPSESAGSTASQTQTPSKSQRKSAPRAAKTPSREPSAVPVSPSRRLRLDVTDKDEKKKEEVTVAKTTVPGTPGKRGRPRKEPVEDAAAAAVAARPVPKRRMTVGSVGAAVARKRSASESVKEKKRVEEQEEEEKEDEEEEDPIAALRLRRDSVRAELLVRRKEDAKRKGGRSLAPIPEDGRLNAVAKVEKKSKRHEDQPSTSQSIAPSRRKRSMSEAELKTEKATVMKTPSKKKARATDKDDEEEEEAGPSDQSILRRSSRKAAVTAKDGPQTPSKSTGAKQ